SWLVEVRAAEESSDSFLAATVRGQGRWSILLRQGLWLRRRRELGALLLAGMAGAVLIDVLSNTLIDSFRTPGFPPYPSLGAAQLPRAILVPQDPDDALPSTFSTTDVAAMARSAPLPTDRVVWDLLGRLGDDPVRRRLFDPFTPVSRLSRGERQRLLLALALSRARADPGCTLLLDEPTSAQDTWRTGALLECVRDLLPARFTGSGAVVLTSHDPEPIDA